MIGKVYLTNTNQSYASPWKTREGGGAGHITTPYLVSGNIYAGPLMVVYAHVHIHAHV